MCCRRGRTSFGSQGFTLIEILIVVLILGIAAAMVVPRVSNMGDLQVMSAARTLLADLQFAQSEAIVTQKPTTVTFDPAAESYTLSNGSGDVTHPLTKKPFVMRFGEASGVEKVKIVSASFGGANTVTFDSLGAPDNGGSVTLDADGHTYRVDIAAVTGRTSVTAVNP